MVDRIERDIRMLKAYAVASSAVIVLLLVGVCYTARKGRSETIEVERINVVEPGGRLALVIANSGRLPGPIIDGEELESTRPGAAGMLFFNGRGDEAGGLIYHSLEPDSGYRAFGHLSFDQYRQDQAVTMTYRDDGVERSAGFTVGDRSTQLTIGEVVERMRALEAATGEERERLQQELQELSASGELGPQRIFLGSVNRTAMVRLKDKIGNDRIKLYVDSLDTARLEFLDGAGNVVFSIPATDGIP